MLGVQSYNGEPIVYLFNQVLVCSLLDDTFSLIQKYMQIRMKGWQINHELEWIGKVAVGVYFKVLSWYYPGQTT
jgi:hypothetical protein